MALTQEDLQAIGALLDGKLSAALEPIQADIADLKENLQSVRTSQLRVELEQYPRIAAALDGVVAAIEKNKEQDERIIVLERKSSNHDTRLFALEASVKAL